MLVSTKSFENGDYMLRLLGSFWSLWFTDNVTAKTIMDMVGQTQFEVQQQVEESTSCISKTTVPIYGKHQWMPLILKQSEKNAAAQLKRLYGTSGLVYGPSAGLYGQLAASEWFSYPLPKDFTGCSHLYNRMVDPSVILTGNADFWIDEANSLVHFKDDPLKNDLISVKQIVDENGNVIDTEIMLWARNATVDKQHVWTHFGYVLNIWMHSSEYYKKLISALWDTLVLGPSKLAVTTSLSAMTGIPVALETETVEVITVQSSTIYIATDKNVYSFKSTATPVVAVGDTLEAGDILVDSFEIIEPGSDSDWGTFVGISIGSRFLGMKTEGPLFFENSQVSLDYLGKDINGRSIVQFKLSGWQADIDAFWRKVHANGLQGKTLAEYVDTRVNPVTQPDQRDIPAFINPFEFVVNNLFRNNAYLIRLRPETFADGAPGISSMAHLYKYLPPHTTYLIFVEMTLDTEYYQTSDLTDGVEFMPAVEPINDALYSGDMLVDKGFLIKLVPENCR